MRAVALRWGGLRSWGLTLTVLLFATSIAVAHDRTTSYSTWEIQGRGAHVTVRLSLLDVSRFPWAAEPDVESTLGAYLGHHLELIAGETPCPISEGPRPLTAAPGRVVYEWRLRCPASGALQIRGDVLLAVAPTHLHFARVTRDGSGPAERLLSEREPTWRLDEPTAAFAREGGGTTVVDYIRLGVEHILSGYDHLAFLLALLLIGGGFGQVARVVTGFTVGHSITLGLVVLGYLRPDPAPVEALIGFSIALVAAENVWLTSRRSAILPCVIAATLGATALAAAHGHGRVPPLTLTGLAIFALSYFGLLRRAGRVASLRWAIAFIFGLVHGCAFAGVLVEAGLPTDRLAAALFGFNLGVEAGQLAAVAVVWPALRYLETRRDDWRLAVLHYGSTAVLALGVFWFVSRTFG
ncbi:MAG: HupE/UreJ family protein [Deltaproteobacteria bacterium]|nr:HupE/UreJ family protein [Deltaproteobacteria bacterium]